MSDTKPAAAKPNRKLLPMQRTLAEHQRNDWVVFPEAGTTLAEMANPEYWAHVAKGTRVLDRIEVRPADGTWWAELLVTVVQPKAMRVEVLRKVTLGVADAAADAAEVPEGYKLENRGQAGWQVKRLSDNEIIHTKAPTRNDASAWLHAHLRALRLAA